MLDTIYLVSFSVSPAIVARLPLSCMTYSAASPAIIDFFGARLPFASRHPHLVVCTVPQAPSTASLHASHRPQIGCRPPVGRECILLAVMWSYSASYACSQLTQPGTPTSAFHRACPSSCKLARRACRILVRHLPSYLLNPRVRSFVRYCVMFILPRRLALLPSLVPETFLLIANSYTTHRLSLESLRVCCRSQALPALMHRGSGLS